MQSPHIGIHGRMVDAQCGRLLLCRGIVTAKAAAEQQYRQNDQARSDTPKKCHSYPETRWLRNQMDPQCTAMRRWHLPGAPDGGGPFSVRIAISDRSSELTQVRERLE